jgi:SSS family solute:Na+ symporter
MVLAVLWSPLCGRFPTLFQGINTAISYLAPPITVVFVAGVFWKKASSKASFITLVTGPISGLIIFVLDFTKVLAAFKIAHPAFSWLNFMVISFIIAVICSIIMIVFSLKYPEELTAEKNIWSGKQCLNL